MWSKPLETFRVEAGYLFSFKFRCGIVCYRPACMRVLHLSWFRRGEHTGNWLEKVYFFLVLVRWENLKKQ